MPCVWGFLCVLVGGHGDPRVAARRILSCMFTWCEFAVWWLCLYCVSLRPCCVLLLGCMACYLEPMGGF